MDPNRTQRMWSASEHALRRFKSLRQSLLALLGILALGMISSCGLQGDCVCTEIYSPVCGSDGLTYNNACKADCAGITHTPGPCPQWANATVINTGSVALDGCGFVLEFDDAASTYAYRFPRGIDSVWLIDSLPIRVEFVATTHLYTCGLAPITMPVVDILSCEYR